MTQWTELVLKVIGPLVAIWGAIFGLWQYRKSQSANRARIAAELMDRFYNDQNTRVALKLVDWNVMEFRLPDDLQLRPSDSGILYHSYAKMSEAFDMANRVPDPERGILEIKPELLDGYVPIYIEIFDRFFSELARIEFYLSSGLVKREELQLLSWWLDKFRSASYNGKNIFRDYLDFYRFTEVNRLIEALCGGEGGAGTFRGHVHDRLMGFRRVLRLRRS